MEVIERKGAGHPDTLADELGEKLASKLEQTYLETYGQIAHYNVDKVLCAAGELKDGEFIKPVTIVFAGQCTKVDNIDELIEETVQEILNIEIARGLTYKTINLLNQGSPDLVNNYCRKKANDTSFAVGSPLTENEELILEIGKYLDSIGEPLSTDGDSLYGRDNKIMFIGNNGNKKAYIGLAFLEVAEKDYFFHKQNLKETIETIFNLEVTINNADTQQSRYITKTGTSLEMGDSGMTGRGNRYNGLITPLKPMTMEAYYGKNNQTHIGRMYQKDAHELAQKQGKNILMLNKIGHEINDPEVFEWQTNISE